jgi:hypothetical protein
MQPGSRGVAANALLSFLAGWSIWFRLARARVALLADLEDGDTEGFNDVPADIDVDGLYGGIGEKWLKMFQQTNGLEPDGGCGPVTREALMKAGFNFEEAVLTSGGKSLMVQPDGSVVLFIAPNLPFTELEVVGVEDTPALP